MAEARSLGMEFACEASMCLTAGRSGDALDGHCHAAAERERAQCRRGGVSLKLKMYAHYSQCHVRARPQV
eukprot:3462327-Amphidinium_carterae.1